MVKFDVVTHKKNSEQGDVIAVPFCVQEGILHENSLSYSLWHFINFNELFDTCNLCIKCNTQ